MTEFSSPGPEQHDFTFKHPDEACEEPVVRLPESPEAPAESAAAAIAGAREQIAGIMQLADTETMDTAQKDVNNNSEIVLPTETYTGTDKEQLATEHDFPVEVDGKTMNVNIQGTGKDIVVLIAGRGVTAPSYDMAPLIEQLKTDRTVMTVDLFGSGLSDMTDTPRTREQISDEVHEALSKFGAKKYTLVAHSLAGVQMMPLVNNHPEEIAAFVGIDSATPGMDKFITPELMKATSASKVQELRRKMSDIAKRLLRTTPKAVREDVQEVTGYKYSEREIATMAALYYRNRHNDDEFQRIKREQDKQAEQSVGVTAYPDNVPVKFFLSSESVGFAPDWYVREHERLLTTATGSGVEVLEGGHFLHHTQAQAIATGIRGLVAG